MPVVDVGSIRITTTFKVGASYTPDGRMKRDVYMFTSYRNTATGRTATAADLRKEGIKRRQAPRVKLTPENEDFLFTRAARAEAGEISGRSFANLVGSKTFGLPTSAQQEQFREALKKMFEGANPSAEELQEWNDMIDRMTPEEAQEFYERHQRDLSSGFRGYHSHWSTVDSDPMGRYTGADQGLVGRQKANRDEVRPRLLNAAGTFLRGKGKLRSTLDGCA